MGAGASSEPTVQIVNEVADSGDREISMADERWHASPKSWVLICLSVLAVLLVAWLTRRVVQWWLRRHRQQQLLQQQQQELNTICLNRIEQGMWHVPSAPPAQQAQQPSGNSPVWYQQPAQSAIGFHQPSPVANSAQVFHQPSAAGAQQQPAHSGLQSEGATAVAAAAAASTMAARKV